LAQIPRWDPTGKESVTRSIFPRRILLATDGSKEAELAALRAVELANATDSYVKRGARRSGAHFPEELSGDARLLWQALRADRRGVRGAAAETVLAANDPTKISNSADKGFGTASIEKAEKPQNELVAEARLKFGDEAVDEVLHAGADACPTDPLLRKICPSCE
jgi:ribonucleoside-diphosphate reductase alpha chain